MILGYVLLWNTMMHNRYTGPEVLYPTQAACVEVLLARSRGTASLLGSLHLPALTEHWEGWCAPVVRETAARRKWEREQAAEMRAWEQGK